MIVFGTRGNATPAKFVAELRCSSCGKSGLNVSTIFRYFHVYWIPFIPTSRKMHSTCPHCEHSDLGKPPDAGDRFGPTVNISLEPFPKYYFAGLLLFIAFIGFGTYSQQQATARTTAYLETPAANDLYVVKLPGTVKHGKTKLEYTVLKLVRQESDGLHFVTATYAYRKPADVSLLQLRAADSFGTDETILSADEIKQMYTAGRIAKVLRPSVP